AVALLGAEETLGLEARVAQPAAEPVLLRALGQPGLELFLLVLGAVAQLLDLVDLARPGAAGVLAEGVDDAGVDALLHGIAALHAEAAEEDALRHVRLAHAEGHG